MPEHVANGVCNAFANDHPDNRTVTDTAWRTPGPGLSVSPDDIWSFWDAPAVEADARTGLWGSAEQAMLANQRPELVETGVLQLSPGVCHVAGHVRYAGRQLQGAEVLIGCRKAVTNIEGEFVLAVPADDGTGSQLIRVHAYWDKPPGILGQQMRASLPPGYKDLGTIELDPPPEWRRRVELHGELTMKHQVMVGHDTIDHHQFSDSLFLQADPAIIALDPKGQGLMPTRATFDQSTDSCGGEKAHLFGTVRVLDAALDTLPGVPPRPAGATDLSVVLDWTYEILDGNDQVDVQHGTAVVPPGQSVTITPALRDSDVPPDRAFSNVTIDNNVNPA
jgi:hypothetical protein